MKRAIKRILFLLAGLGVAALVAVAFLPSPLEVETARAVRGRLAVTVDEDGETRARDRFVVAAPVAGRLSRIGLRDGDALTPRDVVAVIHPAPLDARERADAVARVEAAEALEREARERMAHARADYEQAGRDLARSERLGKSGVISPQSAEQAKNAESTSANELEAARFRVEAAQSDVRAARSRLIALERAQGRDAVVLHSPVRGSVLRVLEKSERVVAAGTPLVVVGDARDLEVVVDVLSTDAVKIQPRASVFLENWGGEKPIRARVRVVEPYAFTKLSALGIEEQRTNVVADFVDPPGPLGDGYRVEARIVIWSGENVLKIPASALFRDGASWAVFVAGAGCAHERRVDAGHRNALEAEIRAGLSEGDEVVLHPPNQLAEGARVRVKPVAAR